MLDRYIDLGGSFIDAANYYTGGGSESIVGELRGERHNRLVLGTKYTLSMREGDPNFLLASDTVKELLSGGAHISK